jgi:propionate catabolism operon transcriptional regulator
VEQAKKYSLADSSILIYGESGTGKELFAQSIHMASRRSQHPFVAVNCAALPESLIDSELFGYEEGSFTGAKKGGKTGLFELAHQGTIFLDEISELPLHLQSRLLRVLQEKEIVRIGGDQLIPIDVRIITASNKDLAECVRQGTFREDLYYRISVLQLRVPPLRQRKEDIPLLFRHFIRHREDLMRLITDADLAPLMQYHWPGNIRELENVAERFLVLCQGKSLDRETIRNILQNACGVELKTKFQEKEWKLASLPDEWERIQLALQETGGNKEKAAKLLGISRSTLWRKLKAGGPAPRSQG